MKNDGALFGSGAGEQRCGTSQVLDTQGWKRIGGGRPAPLHECEQEARLFCAQMLIVDLPRNGSRECRSAAATRVADANRNARTGEQASHVRIERIQIDSGVVSNSTDFPQGRSMSSQRCAQSKTPAAVDSIGFPMIDMVHPPDRRMTVEGGPTPRWHGNAHFGIRKRLANQWKHGAADNRVSEMTADSDQQALDRPPTRSAPPAYSQDGVHDRQIRVAYGTLDEVAPAHRAPALVLRNRHVTASAATAVVDRFSTS